MPNFFCKNCSGPPFDMLADEKPALETQTAEINERCRKKIVEFVVKYFGRMNYWAAKDTHKAEECFDLAVTKIFVQNKTNRCLRDEHGNCWIRRQSRYAAINIVSKWVRKIQQQNAAQARPVNRKTTKLGALFGRRFFPVNLPDGTVAYEPALEVQKLETQVQKKIGVLNRFLAECQKDSNMEIMIYVLKARFNGKTYDEIAKELGVSVDKIKYTMKKIISICKKYFATGKGEESDQIRF